MRRFTTQSFFAISRPQPFYFLEWVSMKNNTASFLQCQEICLASYLIHTVHHHFSEDVSLNKGYMYNFLAYRVYRHSIVSMERFSFQNVVNVAPSSLWRHEVSGQSVCGGDRCCGGCGVRQQPRKLRPTSSFAEVTKTTGATVMFRFFNLSTYIYIVRFPHQACVRFISWLVLT